MHAMSNSPRVQTLSVIMDIVALDTILEPFERFHSHARKTGFDYHTTTEGVVSLNNNLFTGGNRSSAIDYIEIDLAQVYSTTVKNGFASRTILPNRAPSCCRSTFRPGRQS
jgi:hypothetical protein